MGIEFSSINRPTLRMSLSGVVANLDETPSSQERALWRETSGAADIKSDPTATDAYPLDAAAHADLTTAVRFSSAAIFPSVNFYLLFLLRGYLYIIIYNCLFRNKKAKKTEI